MGQLIVLMGPTGAGKSVQGELLAERNGWVHLSSGTLLRHDPQAAAQMQDGRLAPALEVERVVGQALAAVPEDQPVVLDGTPRTWSNVRWLETSLPKLHRQLTAVLLIELDIATSVQRLGLRGRADDVPAAVREKWELFETVTHPVIEHYRELGLLVSVDGRGSIEEVHNEIMSALIKIGVVK
jgi:adenylate kinase